MEFPYPERGMRKSQLKTVSSRFRRWHRISRYLDRFFFDKFIQFLSKFNFLDFSPNFFTEVNNTQAWSKQEQSLVEKHSKVVKNNADSLLSPPRRDFVNQIKSNQDFHWKWVFINLFTVIRWRHNAFPVALFE